MISNAALRDVSSYRLRDSVTQAVCDCLSRGSEPDTSLIHRLRIYERTARQAGLERQTIQAIASGRGPLGDLRDATSI